MVEFSLHLMITEHLCARHHAACRDTAVNKVDLAPGPWPLRAHIIVEKTDMSKDRQLQTAIPTPEEI